MAKSDDILKKYGITQVKGSEGSTSTTVPKTNSQKEKVTGGTKADEILSKYGITQIRGGNVDNFDQWKQSSDVVTSWYRGVERIGKSAYEYLSKEGYKAPRADTLKDVDTFLAQADDVGQYLRANKSSLSNYDELMQNYHDTYSYLLRLRSGVKSSNDYYSQWKTEEDYFKSATETSTDRQQKYEDNNKRIEELKAERDGIVPSTTYNPDSNVFFPVFDPETWAKRKQIDDEIEALETENRQYERGEGGWVSKAVDDNSKVTQNSDFGVRSANRDYKNPTREEIELADVMNDNSTWKWDDANGVYRDAFGNELAVDENNTYYNPAAQQTKVEDKLALYLNTSEDERVEAAMNTGGMREGIWTSVMREGFSGAWEYLTEPELGIYYYYLDESQESADKYLADMEVELNRRRTLDENGQWYDAYDEANLLGKIAMNVATVPAQLASGITGTIDNAANVLMGSDINPYSTAHGGMHFSQTIRGAAAEDLDATGFNIPVIDFSLGDIYQTGMSILDSYAAIGIGGSLGGVLLATNAASSEATRLYQQGASTGQIALGSAAAGAAEMIFESLSIDKLINMKDAKTVGQMIKNVLVQGGIEASEEGFTEIANILTNAVIMGGQSDWAKLVEENGGSTWKAFLAEVQSVAQASFGGFLSGMGSSSIPSAISYGATQAQYAKDGRTITKAEGGIDALKNLANEVAGVSTGKIQESLNKQTAAVDKKATSRKVGRLYNTVQTANNLSNASANQADIAKSLQRKGFNEETANDIAEALVASYNGQELTKAQEQLLKSAQDSQVVKDAISNIMVNEQSTMGQRSQNIRDFQEDIKVGTISRAFGISKDKLKEMAKGNLPSEEKKVAEGSYEISAEGKTVLDGKEVELDGLRKMEDGSIMAATTDGMTADAGEVQYAKKGQAVVYENYVNIETTTNNPVIANMDVESRSALAKAYDPASGVDGKVYFLGSNQAFWYGYEGITMDEKTLPKNSLVRSISEKQRVFAYELGRKAGEKAAKTQDAGIQAAYEKAVEKLGGKEAAATVAKKNEGKAVLEDNIRESSMTKKQRASYQMADIVAKAVGTTVHVYHGMQEYGKYDPATGEIWLNINGNFKGSSMMAFTLAHELVHMAKQWKAADFKEFADYLLEQYGKKGVSVERLIQAQMANAKLNGYTLDEHAAYEEVIADACMRMLLDGDALQKMAAYKEQNPGKWQQIVDAIKKFITNIRKLFNGAEPDSTEAALYKEFDDEAKQFLENKFVEMVMDAGEHMSTIRNAFGKGTVVEVNEDGEFTLAKGNVDGAMKFLYNDSTWERGGRDTLEAALKAEGFSKEDINAALTIMDGKHKLVKELAEQFPEQDRINQATITTDLKDGHSVLSALVSNGDYPVNIDLLMVCKKRKAYQRVINRLCETGLIQQATVDALAIAEINKILGKYGFETACLGCFVESRRLRIQEWANTIVKEWNAEVKKRNPNAQAFGFGKGEATLTQDEVMQLVGELESGGEKNDQGNLNLGQGSAVKRMGVLLDKVPSLRKTLSIEDLITPDGLTALRKLDSNLFSMVKSRYGSNSPKFVQEFNPYNHELAKYGKVPTEYNSLREYLYAIGGARMQSFSDFIVENWFDYCQIVADLAARKLPMHTYTKEISLAKLFGLTGIKINMSLIPDIDRSLGKEFAGLTRNADGELELIWADKDRFKATGGKSYMQSINFADAIALQSDPRYSANVGTIAVGVSDNHILMMLDDARIRMIIPYHSSGMNPIFADLMGTSYYKDYTMFQNTTVKQLYNSKGQKVSLNLDKTQTGKLTSGFQFNEVLQELGDARSAAQAYKDWCADASKHTITIKGETYTAELTPKFNDFSSHKNYYKLLEDFNTYDCISEQAAQQGDVQQIYPENFDQILEGELTAQETHRQKQEANQSFDKAMGEIESYLSNHTKADTVFYAEQHGVKLSAKDKKLGADDKKKLTDLRKGMKNSLPKVDSEGRQLSAEQMEFFKDSVVRDADGNLRVVYHGTYEDFTVFDISKTANANAFGQGHYFSSHKSDAQQNYASGKGADVQTKIESLAWVYFGEMGYSESDYEDNDHIAEWNEAYDKAEAFYESGKVMQVYLNMTNPLYADRYGNLYNVFGEEVTVRSAEYLKELGYDGIVDYKVSDRFGRFQDLDEDTAHYIVFDSNQIKLTSNDKPTSNPDIRYSMPKVPAPTFYSQMAKVVDGMKQEKFGASSVISMLRGKGVKAEEIKWSGIETFLEGRKSVTKAELQAFIAGSMLQIEEEILDNKDRPYTEDQQKRLDEYEAKQNEVAQRLAAEWKKITGEEFPIHNAGAGLESSVVNKIIDANKAHKDASFEGRLLAKLRKDLEKVIADNDDFGFDSWKDALRSIHRHRKDFIKNAEMSTNDKAIIVKYCNALNAYNELPNKISDEDTDRLRAIAREVDPWNRKIMEVKHEHNEEEAKYMTNWKQYSLKGGKNYREMLFRIPGSTYSNEAMFTHWKERGGVLAHARVQDMDTFIGKMLFIEEIQSDWHNAGRKDGYDSDADKVAAAEKLRELKSQKEKLFEEMDANNKAYDAFLTEYWETDMSDAEYTSRAEKQQSERLEFLYKERELNRQINEIEKDIEAATPDAPFKETYHEYVLKRLIREAAEQDYDSIGWTTAETQDDRWQNNLPHKEGTGKSGFLKAYTIEYDQNIRNFMAKFGKKWGTTVGKTVLDNGTEVWSMAITDSMKESVLYEGQPKYSMPKVHADAVEKFGTTSDFEEAGFILPSGEMLKFTDEIHRGERQYDHRAIGMVYGVDVDLNVNRGYNKESNKHLDDFVEKGGIRFDTGSLEFNFDAMMQMSKSVPLTFEQEQAIREFVEWKKKREEMYNPDDDPLSMYRGPLALRIDFGGTSNVALSADRETLGITQLTYEGGQINADRIIADIRHYYQTGEARKPSSVAKFRYAMPKAQNQLFRKPAYDEWDVGDSLDDALDHGDQGYDNLIKVGNMPNFITDLIGIEGEFYIYRNHAYENMVSKKDAEKAKRPTVRGGKEIHFHNLGKERMTEAILSLENPIMTIADSEEFGNPQIVMILPVRGNNDSPLYAALSFYSDTHIKGEWAKKPHIVLTISERGMVAEGGYDGHLEVINKAIESGNVLSYDKEKMRDYLSVIANHTRVGNITSKSLTESVARFRKFVNDFRQKNHIDYKLPNSGGVSSRQLLADAFDELVQTPQERKLMDQYRNNISKVEDVQDRLRKLRGEISKLTKAKGDKAKIAEMNKTAKELAELIDKYDRKLLELEASKPLRDVLARARSAAYQEARQRSEKDLKEYRQQVSERFDRGVEGRRKTEMRKKIRKVIRDLDKILNHGDKKKNVKEDMKDFVAEALSAAEVLFTDNYTNEDIVRNGFGVELSKEEAKYLEEAKRFMDELAILPVGGYDAWQERQEAEEQLKSKLAYRMSKLKDAFFRERQRLNKAEVAGVLGNLADAYAKLETSEYAYVNGAYHEAVYEYLKMLQEDVGGAKVKDMTLGQLEELYKAYTMVLTTVQNANKMFAEDLKQSKEELANRVMMEVYQAGGEHGLWSKGQLSRNQASWNNTKPIYAAERTGSSTFVNLVKGLFKGQYNWATDMEEAKAFRQKVADKYGFKSWDMEKTYKFTSSSGIEFELNLNQIMSLYAYAKREQAHDHLLKGGFVFGKNTEVVVTKNGIKRTYLNKSAKAHNISDEIMGEIVSKLSAEQKGFVDEMQDYLSTTMGEKGNEVSLRLYGVKLFMEKFYFPLRSAGQFKEKAKEAELKQQQGQISIVNSAFTKAVTPKASNPVVLDGFMDVWAGHVNEMSLYHSMVLPMEDFRRVYNYASPNMEGQESASVNSFIENAYGDAATGYFDQLYKELNGGAIIDPRENPSKQMIGKFKKASVMLSNSVWVQQFSAIGRAYALIDPKYFIGSKVDKKKHAVLWNEMKQYAPVAIIKEMGGFDTHTGLSAKDYLLAEEYGKGERIKGFVKDEQYRDEIMGLLPAKADELTWCAIWEAVKRETNAKNPKMDVKSEEFLKKAGERFSEVIEKTQVYDSVLARSANMRSKQGLMQMLTAFMAEPTTTVNMVEDALRKGDKKVIARTFGAVAASIILNNALASIIYAMRDDDEDETFLEKYFQAVASGMLDDINPMTYYPILKDIWSLFQGYDVERTDMAIYSDIADSVKKTVTLIAKYDSEMDEDETAEYYKKVADALMSLLDAGASAFGIPWKNLRRDLMSYYNTVNTFASGGSTTWNSFVDAVGGSALDSIPIVGLVAGGSKGDKLYDAIISGDTAYVNRLKGSYKDENAYSNAVRKALRDNDPRVKEAAQAQINGNPSERVRIAREIIADGFLQDDVVRAINAEINAMTTGESTSTKKEKGFYTAEDFAREIANGDQAAANAAKADVIQTAQKNGKTAEEAEDSFVSSAKTELKELFLSGKISEDKVVDALVAYCDMDESEAELKVESYVWEEQGYEGATSAAVRDYNTFCATSNVPKDVYLRIRSFANNTENDKDASGKSIAYSAMKKVMAEINAQTGLTSAQKTAIARSLGWSEKNIQKYKTW